MELAISYTSYEQTGLTMSEDNSSVSIIDRSPPSSSFPPDQSRSGWQSFWLSTLTTSEVVDVRKEVVKGETEVGKTTSRVNKSTSSCILSILPSFIPYWKTRISSSIAPITILTIQGCQTLSFRRHIINSTTSSHLRTDIALRPRFMIVSSEFAELSLLRVYQNWHVSSETLEEWGTDN